MRLDQLISPVLLPLSWLYGTLVLIRNILYDEHILPTTTVKIPTICVGNIAVGGTGKTPHVEYLIQLLTRHGYKVAVLSRGYKRKTRGFILADETTTAASIGDEPMLIHTKYPDVAVAVCRNRLHGIRQLTKQVEGLHVVILDDGFQHRRLRCGYNIILTAYDNLYVDDYMLPAGRLRDNTYQIRRANDVIITKCPEHMTPIEHRIVGNKLKLASFQHLYFSHMEYGQIEHMGRPLIVTGVAHPEPLLAKIRETEPDAELMAYDDHHPFSEQDVADINERAKHFDTIITTEKDYARLQAMDLPEELKSKLHVQSYRMIMDSDADRFERDIIRYVSEYNRKDNNK